MSNSGFAVGPEQEPEEETPFEAKPEVAPASPATQEGFDEVAVAELKALKEMADKQQATEAGPEHFLEEATKEEEGVQAAPVDATSPAVVETPKDHVLQEVEKILEEDLDTLVEGMNESDRTKFEAKGLEVSGQIAKMVRSFKLKMGKVVALIREWLHTIPGVNKYFLEQEAKIKADKIVDLEEDIKNDVQNSI